MDNVIILPESKFRQILNEELDTILESRIPEIIRRSNRKEYITTAEFKELTGCSHRMQQYYREEGIIPYSQEGRKIFYKTTDVEKFMKDRRVNVDQE